MNKSAGTVTLDKAAASGGGRCRDRLGSIDFGQKQLERWAVAAVLRCEEAPEGALPGRLDGFVNGSPTQVVGELTMRGVTRPLTLKLASFSACRIRSSSASCAERCARQFKRDEFGTLCG